MLAVGEQAPDFTLDNLDGASRRLSMLWSAGPLCVYFYKIECPTSSLVMPVMQRLQRQYGDARVVGVAQDAGAEVRPFVSALGVDFEQLIEPEPYPVSQSFGIAFTPTTFLLDQTGRVAAVAESWRRDDCNALARQLARLLEVAYIPASTEGDGLPAWRPG